MMQDRGNLDISVVITAHREGRLAHRTLQSVRRSIAFAAVRGVRCEIVAVLDRPDAATRSYFNRQPDVRPHEVDHGDVGPSRNLGARAARGRYLNLLDGDDLFSERWLWKAFQAAEATTDRRAVWNPEFTVIFENENQVLRHRSSTHPSFRPENLIEYCHWLTANLVCRDIVLDHPFRPCPPGSGFGSEDWHWHCELLAAGIDFEVVEGTSFFYRRRPGTRSDQHIKTHTVHRATRLLDFAGLERFGFGVGVGLAPLRLEAGAASPSHFVGPLTPPPEDGTAAAPPPRPRSALKTFYDSRVRPRVPGPFDLALRRWYFGAFPMGVKHFVRELPRTGPRAAARQSRRALRLAKRAARAVAPPLVWATLRAAYRGLVARGAPPPLPTAPEAPPFPNWLLEDWRDMHAIEPRIFPSPETIEQAVRIFQLPQSPVGAAYVDICRRLGGPWPSHVFLVPWLTTGGSDRTALNYIQALHDQGWADRILVIATEDFDSPWADRLPRGVDFLHFGRLYRHLDLAQSKALLVRLLLQMAPRMVHNINSWLGYETFATHGKALAQSSRLLGHVFCCDIRPDGQRVGFPIDLVPRCFDVLSKVISDNQTLLDEMRATFDLDPDRLVAHYQPVELGRPPAPRIATARGPLKILWAGRLDRQKRVDVLNAIVAACADDDFEFHAYGRPLLGEGEGEGEGAGPPVPRGPRLRFHGPFDGFESLPAHEFDVFLYTSEWDGLPNVLHEAMARGLVVVASSAGGVKELVQTGKTGHLIEPFNDVSGFVKALRAIDRDRAGAAELARQAHRRLLENHSRERFIQQLAELPGYPRGREQRLDTSAA